MKRILLVVKVVALCAVVYSLSGLQPASAQANPKPFSLPFNTSPGPSTWLLGQAFGNTSGAYNFGKLMYRAGQGLHFGLDFIAPCGTPLVAIADGVVDQVDNRSFGAGPHNLTIFHRDLGYISLYGHLLERPTVVRGQTVKRGEVVATSGDPDRTCVSRPHLHLEIRSRDYHIAYDPVNLIDADWSMLSSIGNYSTGAFAKDLYHPNRWQTLFDQPEVTFNQAILNNYSAAWPPTGRNQVPPQTLAAFTAPAISQGGKATFRQLTQPDCCSMPWWAPDSRSVRFWNGPDGQLASIMAVGVDGGTPQQVDTSPYISADGQYEIRRDQAATTVTRLADKTSWKLQTGGSWPRFSPGSKWLLWQYAAGDAVPGTNPPLTDFWIAQSGGGAPVHVAQQRGGSVSWLDDDRILLMQRVGLTDVSTLSIYTIGTAQMQPLLQARNLRGVSAAPGGQYLMYYLPFQKDSATSGTYLLPTKPGASPTKLPFFGSWRWRDSRSVLYVPFEPGKPMSFVLYDIMTGQSQQVTDPATQPLSILNNDWSISPNGQHIVFWSFKDLSLWSITLPGAF